MRAPLIPYRPLGPRDILRSTLAVLRARLGLFVAITVMPGVVALLGAVVVVVLALAGVLESLLSLVPDYANYTGGPLDLGRIFGPTGWAVLITLVLTGLVSLAAYVMAARTTQDADEGRPVRLLPLLGRTLATLGHLFLILVGGLVAIGALLGLIALPGQLAEDSLVWSAINVGTVLAALLVVPFGTYLALRLAFLVQGLAVEGRTALGTVRRSWQVTRGQVLRVLAHLLLLVVIAAIALGVPGVVSALLEDVRLQQAAQTGANPAGPGALGTIIDVLGFLRALVALALVPFHQVYLTILFIDLTRRADARPPMSAPRHRRVVPSRPTPNPHRS